MRASPRPGLGHFCHSNFGGRDQEPASWGMIWSLAEKVGGRRGPWGGVLLPHPGVGCSRSQEGAVPYPLSFGQKRAMGTEFEGQQRV